MALGFGFNKTKVLGAAEKFVQQGKLQNAIAEYEKVIKEDPKDLTVLNAIGDLYARVGQNEKACEYFKKVGDQYAQNGFTVKAIAVYKKLTRLGTAADALIKLAELYTQQGLFNDARSHYMQVADQLLKSGDNHQAAKVLQKILELDPENTTTQSKLADLYIKLGKTEEARTIYQSAAESLYARKAFDAADEALSRVLSLDPQNQKALLLRGMIASDSGDTASAIQYLEQVPDLDSRPDALRALLHAKLQTGVSDGVEALALKLFTVHQDIGGITALAEWHGAHHHAEEALKLYDQYADRFFAHGPASLVGTLYPLIARIRDNPPALERMLRLLQKAGDTSHLNEVMELLAHAKVQSGDFAVARDLYKELSEAEPENPLHVQNYKQMLAKLGEDSMSRPLTTEESGQALMVEELEHTAPTVHQEYTPTIEKAIEAALTDAELFISYNVPLKAIAPLEAVLPVAPRDLRLNQRLASLYLRAGRFVDAVRICNVLSGLYAEFGHPADSERYAEEAKRYSSRAAEQEAAAPTQVATPPAIKPEPEPPAPTVQEFVLDVPEEFFESAPVAREEPPAPEATVREFIVEAVVEPAVEQPQEIEIDVSHEWESMLTVEPQLEVAPVPEAISAPSETAAPASEPRVAPPEPAVPAQEPVVPAAQPVSAGPDPAAIEDKIQEIRFYISQGFWDMARAALHDLQEMVPESDALAELQLAISSSEAEAAAAAASVPPVEAPPVVAAVESVPTPTLVALPVEANPPDEEIILELEDEPPPAIKVEPPTPSIAAKPAAEPLPAPPPPLPTLEPEEDILGDLVADLEQSLGDFVPGAASKPEPEPEPEPAHAISAAKSQTPIAPLLAQPATSAEMNGEMRDPESTSVLSDILSELQQDLGEDNVEAEDPETHYNLGIAFKEMGLLDEAIGELQKVCHAVEVGNNFSQPVQAYTWLAQCLVDKGVPEAAVRWYQRALQLPGLDHNSRCAIYYDLGSAFEASGDKKSALANFMEVYGSNIDFRDVASRIKVLKS
jgi:pilus assembly protein FimV